MYRHGFVCHSRLRGLVYLGLCRSRELPRRRVLDRWASTAKCYLSRFFVRSSAPWDDICELQGDVDGTFYIGPCTGVMTAATRA